MYPGAISTNHRPAADKRSNPEIRLPISTTQPEFLRTRQPQKSSKMQWHGHREPLKPTLKEEKGPIANQLQNRTFQSQTERIRLLRSAIRTTLWRSTSKERKIEFAPLAQLERLKIRIAAKHPVQDIAARNKIIGHARHRLSRVRSRRRGRGLKDRHHCHPTPTADRRRRRPTTRRRCRSPSPRHRPARSRGRSVPS